MSCIHSKGNLSSTPLVLEYQWLEARLLCLLIWISVAKNKRPRSFGTKFDSIPVTGSDLTQEEARSFLREPAKSTTRTNGIVQKTLNEFRLLVFDTIA